MIKTQRGMTLIELMVSMMLGLSLVAGVSQLFIQSQKSFTLQRNLSDMIDDGSFILEAVAKGVLLAGFSADGHDFDCNIVKMVETDPATGIDTSSKTIIDTCDHISNTQTAVLGSTLNLDCSNNVNVLKQCTPSTLSPPCTGGSKMTTTTSTTTICETIKGDDSTLIYRYRLEKGARFSDGLLISDACDKPRKGSCELDNFICTSDLKASENDMISVYFQTKKDGSIPVFYCRAAKHTPPETDPISTPDRQPIISEVEKLEFRYGINDKTSKPFYYVKAAEVTDWKKVFSIKVFVVLRSVDDKLTHNKISYEVDGIKYNAPDNRLYKVFSKTIYLRATPQ